MGIPEMPKTFATARRAAWAAAVLLALSTAGARAGGDDLFGSPVDEEREAAIRHLATQTADGLTMLARFYIQGSMTPLVRPDAAEFLYAVSAHRREKSWQDAALGATGAWVGLHLNDYLKWGAVDSTRADIPPAGDAWRPFKSLADQSSLLEAFTMAYQASGKDLFKRAATATANDLLKWSRRDGRILDWVSNDPDSIAGPDAPAAVVRLADQRLTRAAIVFGEPAWVMPGADPSPAPAEPGPAPTLGPATADTIAVAESALALVRRGQWTHADSLGEEAARRLEPLALAGAPETRSMPLFAARAAAGLALELLARPTVMAYIVGDSTAAPTLALRDAAIATWRPGKLVQVRSAGAADLLYPPSGDGAPLAYVCSGELCAPPTSDPAEVRTLVSTFSLPEAPETTAAPGQ
jgi:hypothetical protein